MQVINFNRLMRVLDHKKKLEKLPDRSKITFSHAHLKLICSFIRFHDIYFFSTKRLLNQYCHPTQYAISIASFEPHDLFIRCRSKSKLHAH